MLIDLTTPMNAGWMSYRAHWLGFSERGNPLIRVTRGNTTSIIAVVEFDTKGRAVATTPIILQGRIDRGWVDDALGWFWRDILNTPRPVDDRSQEAKDRAGYDPVTYDEAHNEEGQTELASHRDGLPVSSRAIAEAPTETCRPPVPQSVVDWLVNLAKSNPPVILNPNYTRRWALDDDREDVADWIGDHRRAVAVGLLVGFEITESGEYVDIPPSAQQSTTYVRVSEYDSHGERLHQLAMLETDSTDDGKPIGEITVLSHHSSVNPEIFERPGNYLLRSFNGPRYIATIASNPAKISTDT